MICLAKIHRRSTIKTNVSDAYVYLNGNFQGKTPITILNLAEGRYQLRIEKEELSSL